MTGPAPAAGPATSLIGSWPTTTVPPTHDHPSHPDPLVVEDALSAGLAPAPAVDLRAGSWPTPRSPAWGVDLSPGVPVPSGRAMASPSPEGLDQVFLVRGREPGWLLAQIMSRPNSAMAWIRESDVTLRRVPNHIVVERGAKRLTLYHGEEVLMQVPVATGKAPRRTPVGTFFVDARVRLSVDLLLR